MTFEQQLSEFIDERDPVYQLFVALERDGKPGLAWVVAWSDGDREPVRAAWLASSRSNAMRLLATRWMKPSEWDHLFGSRGVACCDEHRGDVMRGCPRCADVIRRVVPSPPTLQFLIETSPCGRFGC